MKMVDTLGVLILFQFLTLSCSQSNFVHYVCDSVYGNYTSNSTYQQNLNTLLSDISSNAKITYGFYNFSAGLDPNRVNGIGMCRGDVLLADCHSCLKNATASLIGMCTYQKQAIGWYDTCMLRYTNRSIFGVMEDTPYWVKNRLKALDQDDFTRILSDLFGSLQNKTEAGNSTLKYAIGRANVSTSATLYAYTQCTPDLSQSDCGSCLSESISKLADCCLPYQGTRFFRGSCDIRYEVYKFSNAFDTLAPSPSKTPSSPPPTSALSTTVAPARGKGRPASEIVIVVVVIVVCLLLVIVVYFCLKQQRREWREGINELRKDVEITSTETLEFTYGEIEEATHNFAEANMLERGEFGSDIVYKGVLANGQEIAVKRLAGNSMQGELEFRNEVVLVAKLQHHNLVRLLGFSSAGEERLLIYEFVPSASLDHFLFGKNRKFSLDWHTRYKIIRGIAQGLLYLHEDSRLQIIHCDLKASNILLDAHLNPKIADSGLARLFHADQTHADTQKIAGSFGYVSPEYAYRGVFSVKSDVYNFGVLVLEIICGKKNYGIQEDDDAEDLITSVWRNWTEGTASQVVESTLRSASRVEIMRCIRIGLLCTEANPDNRPTMSSVNLMLSSELCSMPVPSQPAQIQPRSMDLQQQTHSQNHTNRIHNHQLQRKY